MPRDVTVTGGSRSDKQIGAVPGWADDEAIEPLGAIHWSGGSSAPCSTDFTNRSKAYCACGWIRRKRDVCQLGDP
jgi:hypothetical protein